MPARAVGDPGHPNLPEHGQKRPPVPGLHAAAAYPLAAGDLPNRGLALRAQVEVILQHHAKQLARVDPQARLKLTVRQRRSVRAVKPAQRPLKALPRGGEAVGPNRLAARRAQIAREPDRSVVVSLSAGQDSIARRVTFTTTGVELGDHVATSGWSTLVDNADLRHPSYVPLPATQRSAPGPAAQKSRYPAPDRP